jgi:uncharacterized protein involved in response to NO
MPPARAIAAHAVFFPAAALYGAAVLASSVLDMTGAAWAPASLSTPSGHAHEMLLGYALAVVAGYQLPALPAARLWSVLALWLLARVCFLVLDVGAASAALDAAFAIVLAAHAVPRLARSAKNLSNMALPGLLVAICLAALAVAVVRWRAGAPSASALHVSMILLLAALMLFMGGRMIAPMVAGAFYQRGQSLGPRVQPRIEAALLVSTAAAALAALSPALDIAMRVACLAAGLLAAVRLARWRLWVCADRGDILRAASGYAWLAIGLFSIAATSATALRVAALHFVTIGALGTLSFNVMARVARVGTHTDDRHTMLLTGGTALIAIAALLRFASALWPAQERALLLIGAACWSVTFVGLFALLLQAASARRRRRAAAVDAGRPARHP